MLKGGQMKRIGIARHRPGRERNRNLELEPRIAVLEVPVLVTSSASAFERCSPRLPLELRLVISWEESWELRKLPISV